MDNRAHNGYLSSAQPVVMQLGFALLAYFVLTAVMSPEAWSEALAEHIASVWVFALPADSQHRNQWKIALELKSGKIITLELYGTGGAHGAVTLVRALNDDPANGNRSEFALLMKIRVTCIGRRATDNVTVCDVIDQLSGCSLLSYKPRDGRGHRFWAHAVLTKIRHVIRELTTYDHLPAVVYDYMRRYWPTPGGDTQQGYAGQLDDLLNIKEGIWAQK